jgi:hypothetical protein
LEDKGAAEKNLKSIKMKPKAWHMWPITLATQEAKSGRNEL